jgi:hydroxyacylglutathione hydrolase
MIFQPFLLDVNEANVYVVSCEESREALLIDAGDADPRIGEFVERNDLKLTGVFITHDHYDHTGGLGALIDAFPIAHVFSGRGRAGGRKAKRVSHGDTLRVGALTATVLETPGHTPDSISLVFPGLVFPGDALFSGSVGGTSSASDAKRQIDALRRYVLSLPDEYEVHPGHGPSSTVAIERRFNPFFV